MAIRRIGSRQLYPDRAPAYMSRETAFSSSGILGRSHIPGTYRELKAGFQIKDNDLDKLRAVTIYHSLEGCL